MFNSAAAIYAGLRQSVIAGDGVATVSEARAAEITAELTREYVEHSRALQNLRLAGPKEVSDAVELRAAALARVVNGIRSTISNNSNLDAAALNSLGAIFQQYIDTAAELPIAELMQKSLEP